MEYDPNFKAHYALSQAFNDVDVSKFKNCLYVYHIWQVLITTHEGTTQLKKVKIDLLNSQYENVYKSNGESIDEMFARFTTITNIVISLGKPISND